MIYIDLHSMKINSSMFMIIKYYLNTSSYVYLKA